MRKLQRPRTELPSQGFLAPSLCNPSRIASLRVFLAISTVFSSASRARHGRPQPSKHRPRLSSPNAAAASRPLTRKKPTAAEPALRLPRNQLAPPAPKPPNWPANDPPGPASVVWDSHGLAVAATNSSLAQILKEVSVDTGVKIEGFSRDERIFGTYGPGPARDVLSQLLDGTNYDVLMIGDQGQGTPRQVVLTLRPAQRPQATT